MRCRLILGSNLPSESGFDPLTWDDADDFYVGSHRSRCFAAIAAIAPEAVAIVGICNCGIYSLLDQKHSRKDSCAFQSSPGAGPGSEPRSRAGWQPRTSA